MSIIAKVIKIKNEINTKITNKLFSHDGSITMKVEKNFTNVYKMFNIKVNTKIVNKLFTHLAEINSFFTIKLSKINTKLNSKLITEIKNFKAYNADYASKVQRILLMINNVIIRFDEIK